MDISNKLRISDKKIVKKALVPLPVSQVWDKWTTSDGLLSFFGEKNNIEMLPGGKYEIYFLMDNPYGLRGSEGCEVLSYLPNKMFSFTWNAPPSFPEIRKSDYKTWVVIEFEESGDLQTQLTLTHLGWPENKTWNPVFDYFDHAWGTVLDWLLKSIK